mmetsp:Transcript_23212/g.39875  ORF Transcript_23212/g.39875 Transcript_23212/m.39875 type:complete len:361 (+) Transcript_23212:47-1129(+)|eukprot:CAMPEP_0196660576 /NCGR_PEP_ID=MMETSP1086-20130531/40454_1 /TAXON_ID=77921 /ORGANISM="Cyanoptyche  gloeocystis , Strain SAG4.97" /LENGTH=360 /DNA_ID=CAMNT_0041995055 /DNA_START=47 /DNA_END=1129 /DNA_ORIENTATION=+
MELACVAGPVDTVTQGFLEEASGFRSRPEPKLHVALPSRSPKPDIVQSLSKSFADDGQEKTPLRLSQTPMERSVSKCHSFSPKKSPKFNFLIKQLTFSPTARTQQDEDPSLPEIDWSPTNSFSSRMLSPTTSFISSRPCTPSSLSSQESCVRHDEVADQYCVTCRTPLCLVCCEFDDRHARHEITSLESHVTKCRRILHVAKGELECRAVTIEEASRNAEKSLAEAEVTSKKMEEEARAFAELMRKTITDTVEMMIQQRRRDFENIQSSLKSHISSLSSLEALARTSAGSFEHVLSCPSSSSEVLSGAKHRVEEVLTETDLRDIETRLSSTDRIPQPDLSPAHLLSVFVERMTTAVGGFS